MLITVNAQTGTPEEAADWVRYVNIEKKGHVRYWEVGNELYNNNTMRPDQYADRLHRFAQAMRAVDPSIQIGAIGPDNYPRIFSGNNWTEQVLSRVGGEVDFFSVHNGYAPVLTSDPNWDVRTVYSAMLAAPKLVEANLTDVSKKLQQQPSTRGREIKIAVTEWGPLFQGTPQDRFVDHTKTLASGLYTASMMKVLLENPHVEIANFFKLVDPLFAGWIGMRGGKPIPKPTYLAFQMYTHHFGRVLLGSSTVSPTYDSLSVGWVDAVKDVPYLETVASRSDDGRTLYLMVINKNFDQEMRANIDLRGFSPASEGKAWTLSGPGIDANTGTELFQAPGVKWTQQAEDEKNPRFRKGDPGEVMIVPSRVANVGRTFQYNFPPRSVTAIEIAREEGRPTRH